MRKKRGKRKGWRRRENSRRTRKRTRWRERREREGEGEVEENGGCEAAVKRGRVRVGPSQLAGRVDADRELKGRVDGRGRRGQGRRRREGRGGSGGEWRETRGRRAGG